MSSPVPAAAPVPVAAADGEAPASPDGWRDNESRALGALRAELDRIDDALHDLLIERSHVVAEVARTGKRTALRPGRQAAIIRRLLARHHGPLPPLFLVRIWLELLAGTTAMQGPFAIAVCAPEGDPGYVQAAREQFGALTPVRIHRSPAHAIGEVSAGTASVAVLPLPSETDTARDAWWTALLRKGEPRIHVVARLPLWRPRPEGAPDAEALVVAVAAPDPSGLDRTLLGLELPLDVSRARLTAVLGEAGLGPGAVILRRDAGASVADALVEVDGYVTEDDPRLGAIGVILQRPVVLGAYAVPLEGAPA
jgi:chorismate mutase/prephenate dehydratase